VCGICGLFERNDVAASLTIIKNMGRILAHRGPNDEGYVAVDSKNGKCTSLTGPESATPGIRLDSFAEKADLFLAHRRLSVIDLSPAGHQPMSSADGKIWIVFNGEIYNYRELRSELRSLGHVFRTETDTEVVVASYVEWGEGCLDRFDGMWAFVLYDSSRTVLFGSRDRFGVKPLYYVFGCERFAFASEIKALLSIPSVNSRARAAAVYDYVAFGVDCWSDGTTFFNSVFELPPAHAFLWKIGDASFKPYRYYTLPFEDEWEPFDHGRAAEHVRQVRECTIEAVRRHLMADVPVGSCLSGGVDSSSIVGVIRFLLEKGSISQVGDRLKTFTACYPGRNIDESSWARLMADHVDASRHTTEPTGEALVRDLEDLVYSQDCPFGSTSIYAQYRVMKCAWEAGVTVLLDGQGGDELFTGYAPYYVAFFREMLRRGAWEDLRREWKAFSSAPLRRSSLVKMLLRDALAGKMPVKVKNALFRVLRPSVGYLNKGFASQHAQGSIERRFPRNEETPSLNGMLQRLMCSSSLPALLRYEDRNSMRFSIESRTPFADDRRLVETVFAIPASYKIHEGYSKWLLREAMKDFLPGAIYARTDKIGFATPETAWLVQNQKDLAPYIDALPGEVFETKRLRADWSGLAASFSSSSISPLWRYLNLAIWWKKFNVSDVVA
jgi:asparagine synthase (glutamine-hydrolysing)